MFGNKIKSGFTLVELLVTIGIIVLLMIVAVPNFAKYRNINDLNNAAKLIQSEIYKARNMALAPAVDKRPESDAYSVDLISTNDTQGTIFSMRIWEINQNEDIAPKMIESINLPKNIAVDNTAVDLNGVNNYMNIVYSILGYGRIEQITYMDADLVNNLNYSITISSSKVGNDIKKKLTVNKVTGQVSITTVNGNE